MATGTSMYRPLCIQSKFLPMQRIFTTELIVSQRPFCMYFICSQESNVKLKFVLHAKPIKSHCFRYLTSGSNFLFCRTEIDMKVSTMYEPRKRVTSYTIHEPHKHLTS